MTQVTFHQSAEEHERYAPHAFDGIIGQDAPFKVAGTERGRAVVVAVEVDKDGRGATWTVDLQMPEEHKDVARPANMSFSIPKIPARWWD